MTRLSSVHVHQAIGVALSLVVIAVAGWVICFGIAEAPAPPTVAVMSGPAPAVIRSPLDVFDTHNPPLIRLSAWAKIWQANWATSRPSESSDIARLGDLIDKSGLGAADQLSVGQYILGRGDKHVAAVWFHCAISQTKAELNAARKAGWGSEQEAAELVVRPLLPMGLDAGNALLGEQETKDEPAIEKLLTMEMMLKRENQWDQRPEWVRIAHGESLLNQGRFDHALEEAQALEIAMNRPGGHFIPIQRAEIHWLVSLIYLANKQGEEAIPHLEAAANEPEFHLSKNASYMALEGLLRAGHIAEAKQYKQLLVKRGLTVSDSVFQAAAAEFPATPTGDSGSAN